MAAAFGIAGSAVGAGSDSGAAVYPLSSVQRIVWLDQMLDPRSVQYNICLAMQIDGDLDVGLLQQSIEAVVARHDVLRLVMPDSREPQLSVLPAGPLPLPVLDFSDQAGARQLARSFVEKSFREPFELQGGRLWRIQLVRVDQAHWYWSLQFHHLILDGSGMSLVHQAIAAEYSRRRRADADTAIDPPQYAEFLEADRAYLASQRFERDRQFWLERFAEVPPSLLPRSAVTSAATAVRMERIPWQMSRGVFDRLSALATSDGLSITHIMLALVAAQFARTADALAETPELVIGLPVRNRGSARDKCTIGMFSTVVPLLVTVNVRASFLELVGHVAAELRRCYRHQRFPMEELNRSLALHRLGRRQVFDVSLSIETFKFDEPLGEHRSCALTTYRGIHAPLAVSVHEYHQSQDVQIELNYDSNVLSAAEVAAIRDRLALMVGAVLERPEESIAQLPIMAPDEWRRVVHEFNATQGRESSQLLAHEQVEVLANRQPNAIAVIAGEKRLTRGELNRRSDLLADRLRQLGVKANSLVALCLEPGLDTIVSVLAILKAGGAYVPLDPAYPAQRLAFMLRDASPNVVLTHAKLRDVVREASGAVVELDREWTRIEAAYDESEINHRKTSIDANCLAYVIYTSGSTGTPKGVMIEHGSLLAYAMDARRLFELTERDTVLQQNSLNFDLSVEEIFPALLSGAALQVSGRSFGLLGSQLGESKPSVVHLTTAHFNMLLAEWIRSPLLAQEQLSGVRLINVTGDVLTRDRLAAWHSVRPPQTELVNTYGPTEATVSCTAASMPSGSEVIDATIGKPIAHARIYVLDARGQPVPIGVAGEIFIGGPGVGRGYLNRPDLTAERFVSNPFDTTAQASTRLYRTGDVGRWRHDGNLEYVGRRDEQVKIRGFRIEPAEIEARLLEHEAVKEAVVVVIDSERHQKQLIAYVTLAAGLTPEPGELQEFLRTGLPEYMVPGAVVELDRLPLTPGGKLDRKALPAPRISASRASTYRAPIGRDEVLLARIWCEVLRLDRVGRSDNFFDLGGHSLLALQVLARVRQLFGRELLIRALFDHPTVAALAPQLGGSAACAVFDLVHVERAGSLPLSPAQRRLWFLDQLENASAAYTIAGTLTLHGALDRTALQSALDGLVERHEPLRTTFECRDGEPLQLIAPIARFQLAYVSAPEADSRAHSTNSESLHGSAPPGPALTEIIAREIEQPFSLATGPLIRGLLIECAPEHYVLVLTMHHIIADGWSIGVLTQDLAELYRAHRTKTAPSVAELHVQYADYALWQRNRLVSGACAKPLEYWKSRLAGVEPELALPTDRPRKAAQTYRGDNVAITFDRDLIESVRELARRNDVTAFMVILAAWAALLSRLSGQREVVVGVAAAGRRHTEVERLVGFFVNLLPLRLAIESGTSVRQLLADTKRFMLEASENEELPFEQIVEAVRPERSFGRHPLFQTMLAFQNVPRWRGQLDDLSLALEEIPAKAAQCDLTLTLEEVAGGISGRLNYAVDLFERGTVERWVGHFGTLLAAMAKDDAAAVDRLSILSQRERDEVLRSFNAVSQVFPRRERIEDLFARQVLRQPEAVAIVEGDRQLTYAQLNAAANRLAYRLIEQGARAGEYVPIIMPRSAQMVIAQLAVLKTGCAYVPLDPLYPPERIEFLIADCAARCVIVDSDLHCLKGISVAAIDVHESATAYTDENPASVGDAESAAYVMFTSGSTGEPKGVIVPHRAVSRVAVNNGYAAIEPADCVAHCSNPAFDASTFEVWGALLNGARLLIVSQSCVLDPHLLAEILSRERVSALFLTTTLFNQCAVASPSMFSTLKHVLIGGEAADAQAARRVLARGRPENLVNAYGPTESTTFAASHRIESLSQEATTVPIGRPISNTRIYILDSHGEPVPPGVAGEIFIGGAGVALGYLNRPELTAARFVPDRFSSEPAARLYRTGDLGRFRADGTIDYLGRNDRQVKIRGFRIELGEIEAHLARHPHVKDAVVLAREDVPAQKRLVAYITHQVSVPSSLELREHLQTRLPEYMIPAAYVQLESIPLTSSGKVDWNALPAPDLGAYEAKTYESPEGEIETALAEILQDLLHLERVGRNDNFFELGGHSLLIVQLIEQLRQRGLRTEVRNVFDHPILSALATCVSAQSTDTNAVPPNLIPAECKRITPDMLPLVELTQEQIQAIAASVPGGAKNIQDIYPLAPLQEGILFHHLMSKRGDTYVLPTLLSMRTRGEVDAFIAALQAVIDRHDILRTAVLWEGLPQAIQVVHRRAKLPVLELSLDAGTDSVAYMRSRMELEHQRLDLSSAPLLRLQVAPDHGGQWLVLLQLHHIVSDHVALRVVIEELQAQLSGERRAKDEPAAYRDYVAHALARARTGEAEAFFRARLQSITEPTAPFGFTNVHGDGSRIEERESRLPGAQCERIRAVSRRMGISAAALFHTAWAMVVGRTSGRDDVVFGTVLSGRMQSAAGAQRTLGMFINTLPLRVKLSGLSAEQAVLGTQRELVELLKYEQASLAMAQRCSGIEGAVPLFTALFNYRHGEIETVAVNTLSNISIVAAYERTNYPFTLSVDDEGSGFKLTAQIDSRVEAGRVLGFLERALEVLVSALEHSPRQAVMTLDVLPAVERRQIVTGFNPQGSYDVTQTLSQLFEAQVARRGDAIAVSFEGADVGAVGARVSAPALPSASAPAPAPATESARESACESAPKSAPESAPESALVRARGSSVIRSELSYAQLNARANQLAYRLRELGVGPESRVALYMERGVELVVGILGILKAGGAYVPVDAGYPAQRVLYVLEDAAPSVVVTQESLHAQLPSGSWTAVCVDSEAQVLDRYSPENPASQGHNASQLAYVIYTSGSTGSPKGVMVEHRHVVRLFSASRECLQFDERDVWTLFHSVAFDFSVWELWGALLHGGRAVVVSQECARSPDRFYDLLCDEGVTVLSQTPGAFRQLSAAQTGRGFGKGSHVKRTDAKQANAKQTDANGAGAKRADTKQIDANGAGAKRADTKQTDANEADAKRADAKQTDAECADAKRADAKRAHELRYVTFGGEALELHSLQSWVDRNGAQRPQLVNMYGITETTVHVTCRVLSEAEIREERSSVVGRALEDLRVYLLDTHLQPVPIGVAGEIYVGGAGVARGYLNRPELTRERFIADPFSSASDARIYKTGDLGRWRADGVLEYLGRNDSQVKIRGFRIELGEIEAQLARQRGVKEAIVVVREGAPRTADERGHEADAWTDRERAEHAQRDEPSAKHLAGHLAENDLGINEPVERRLAGHLAENDLGINERSARRAEPFEHRLGGYLAENDLGINESSAQRAEPVERRLVAYLTGDNLDTDEIRAQLKANLPEYMVPSALVVLEQLPLTPNGKVDRKALPAPELTAYSTQRYEAPEGEIEQALAQIWRTLLGHERIGRHDNFFELGGHSLLIVQLVEQLRQRGLRTEVRSVFDSPTLSELAKCVNTKSTETYVAPPNLIPAQCERITPDMLPLVGLTQEQIDKIAASVPGGAKNIQDIYPLAPLQEGILFHHLMSEQGDTYVLPTLLSMRTREELDALIAALQSVIDRHDILRTAVLWEGLPQAVQVVYRRAVLQPQEVSLSADVNLLPDVKLLPGVNLIPDVNLSLNANPASGVRLTPDLSATSDRNLGSEAGLQAAHDPTHPPQKWASQFQPSELALPATEEQAQLRQWMAPQTQRMQLTAAPLLRLKVAPSTDGSRWYALLQMHHIATDHVGLEIVVEEVKAHLSGRLQLLSPAMPYRSYVGHALAYARRGDAERFFGKRLSDITEPTAPFGVLDVHGDAARIEESSEELTQDLANRIRRLSRRLSMSSAALFHLACALAIARTSARDDVVFGTVLSGRLQGTAGADRALGLFINTLPLRLKLSGITVEQALANAQRELVELLSYEQASLAMAQRCSGISGAAPLFTTIVNYRHSAPESGSDVGRGSKAGKADKTDPTENASEAGKAGDDHGITVLAGQERTNYALTLSIDDFGERFGVVVQCDRRIGSQRMLGYVTQAVSSVLIALEHSPKQAVMTLDVLPPAERYEVLERFNATAAEYPREALLHELFELQVERTPDAIAVSFETQQVTYRELNAKANQLARYLRDRGIGVGTRDSVRAEGGVQLEIGAGVCADVGIQGDVRPVIGAGQSGGVRIERSAQLGAGADACVGVCAERSVELVIGLLGILKAGAAYVPLDPSYPRDRLQWMVSNAQAPLILTQSHLRALLPAEQAVAALDEQWDQIGQYADENLTLNGQNSRSLAYVIYTSGSTGTPKGAMNEHRAVVNRLYWMQQAYALGAQDRVLQKTPYSFDVSVWEFFWPLLYGARLVLARPGGHQDAQYLSQLMESEGITRLHFVPSMLQAYLESGGKGESLRQIVCSGEELSEGLKERCLRRFAQARLDNLYGPTEAAIDVTYWRCVASEAGRVPIGRPISNVQMYVLDAYLQPVPIGVAGEIYIGGVGVGRGYLNRPELTRERFIADPFSSEPGARLYKTGDLGRWRADGALEYLGRNDTQVKIRGFRIELGEIEAQLARQRGVKEAIVLAREGAPHAVHDRGRVAEAGTGRESGGQTQRDKPTEKRVAGHFTGDTADANEIRAQHAEPTEKRLVAYLIGESLDIDEIRAQLKATLPEYMVPSALVVLEQLPLTPNGKVDRKALPAPELEAFSTQRYEAPQGEIEPLLAHIWRELLGHERVGRHDNFFELGGHSLLIVQLVEQLRQRGLRTEVRNVFDHPTLSELAQCVSTNSTEEYFAPPNRVPENCEQITPDMLPLVELSQEQIEKIAASVPGGAKNIQDIYPLAPLQEGILFHHLMSEHGDTYVLSSLLSVQTREELSALVAALQAVIDRHDVLRTAVVGSPGTELEFAL